MRIRRLSAIWVAVACAVTVAGCRSMYAPGPFAGAYQPGGALDPARSDFAMAAGIDDDITDPSELTQVGAGVVRSVPLAETIANLAETFGAHRVAGAASSYAAAVSSQGGHIIDSGGGENNYLWAQAIGIGLVSALGGGVVGGKVAPKRKVES